MKSIPDIIVNHKKSVVVTFLIVSAICIFLFLGVTVNYNMADYLPDDSVSTKSLDIMRNEFSEDIPNARVAFFDISLTDGLECKRQLKSMDGISAVMWLDDVADISAPLETIDVSTVETYYKNNNAVFDVTVKKGQEVETLAKIRDTYGDKVAINGEASSTASSQQATVGETLKAFMFLIPIILLILFLTTSSWIEPFLFLAAIGIGVIINMGTNIFFKDISYITQSVSPILQMAVSLDYAIFLLSNFKKFRKDYEPNIAMKMAMKRSFSSVLASALTTLFGFLALVFMRFGIGSDLGINLVKGIVFSFVSVMVFLPALTLCLIKLIDKTTHRTLKPSFSGLANFITKIKIPVMILILILIVPSFLAQQNNSFLYGMGAIDRGTRAGIDDQRIQDEFGKSTSFVLLVPKGEIAKEEILCNNLKEITNVTNVLSYTTTVGKEIPQDYIDNDIMNQFVSEKYSRIILYAQTETESPESFTIVENIRADASEYYNEVLTCGESVSLYDIRDVVSSDSTFINILAIVLIGLVLLFTFRSVWFPLILLLTIESAIWINLAIPYFTGSVICYIGFLVINTVQLGATVDYAILFTDHYRHNLKLKSPLEAIKQTICETFSSIVISASILSSAGFIIQLVSTNEVVSGLGGLLGTGTVLSSILVLFFLPGLLLLRGRGKHHEKNN